MQKSFFTAVLVIIFHTLTNAQVVSPAEQMAGKIAQRLKDSLSLNDSQKQQLFSLNMRLHQQKQVIRQQYAGLDSMGYYMQKIENSRDSLYKQVLPEDKYLLYKQKKIKLVNNN